METGPLQPALSRETKRQLLHISMVVFALLLRPLDWWMGAICAGLALAHNLFILPHTGAVFRREGEGRLSVGMTIYPITVLTLIIVFRQQLYIAAAGWAILAFGDGFATIAGKRYGASNPLPWNAQKSFAGMAGYVVAAGLGAAFFIWWTAPNWFRPHELSGFQIGLYALTGSLVAAMVESIPSPIDDNLTAPLAGASALWFVAAFV